MNRRTGVEMEPLIDLSPGLSDEEAAGQFQLLHVAATTASPAEFDLVTEAINEEVCEPNSQ